MHNLRTVFQFEVKRSLKKKSFWITALSFPLIIAAVGAVIYFSNKTTSEAAEDAKNQRFSIALTDESGIIKNDVIKSFNAERIDSKQEGIERVRSGSLDAYFYYPKDLSKQAAEVYGRDVGLFDNSRYQGVSEVLLKESADKNIPVNVSAVLKDNINTATTTFKDGAEYDGFKQLIAPGVFLILFYILMAFFGNQMLTSTTEEKENRVIEMLLTTIEARTLVVGKILSLIILAFIQILIIMTPLIILYLVFGSRFELPNVDLSNLPLDPARIAIGAVLFAISFMLFTGLLVAIGAATPTAKEASGYFGLVMILIFGPLYAASLFVSSPDSGLVRFLSFFPFTAPIPLMLRNAVGNLSVPEAILGIGIMAITASIVLSIAIRIFRFGVLEYSRSLSLKEIFSRKS